MRKYSELSDGGKEKRIAAYVFSTLGIIFVLGFVAVALSSDVENFNPHPDKANCLIVEYKTDTLTGPTVDKSGIYCKEQ